MDKLYRYSSDVCNGCGVWSGAQLLEHLDKIGATGPGKHLSAAAVATLISANLRAQISASTCHHRPQGAAILSIDPEQWAARRGLPYIVNPERWQTCGDNTCRRLRGLPCPRDWEITQALDAHKGGSKLAVLITTDVDYMDHISMPGLPPVAAIVHWSLAPMGDLQEALGEVRYLHAAHPQRLQYADSSKGQRFREYLLALHQELAEVADCMAWKPYQDNSVYARKALLGEIADVVIYLDLMLLLFGADWRELAEQIQTKTGEIERRISGGYYDN